MLQIFLPDIRQVLCETASGENTKLQAYVHSYFYMNSVSYLFKYSLYAWKSVVMTCAKKCLCVYSTLRINAPAVHVRSSIVFINCLSEKC